MSWGLRPGTTEVSSEPNVLLVVLDDPTGHPSLPQGSFGLLLIDEHPTVISWSLLSRVV